MHFVHLVISIEGSFYNNSHQTLNVDRNCTENIQNNMLQAGMHSKSAKKTKNKITCISSFNLAKKFALITDSFKELVKSNYKHSQFFLSIIIGNKIRKSSVH